MQVDPRDEVVAMSPLRKRVAKRLVQAQHESASLTTFNEVDMTQVRSSSKRASCKAFPGVNAEVIVGNIVGSARGA